MKCPECGFVSFDDLDRCKRCGFNFAAYRRGESVPRSSLLSRLRGKVANGKSKSPNDAYRQTLGDLEAARETTRRESDLRRDRETATRDYLARERKIREEKAQLRRTYDRTIDQNDKNEIRKQIDLLEGRRQKLTEEKKAFEVRQRALEKKMRDQTALARLKVKQELKEAEESVMRRREHEEAELKKMQLDLEAQQEKIRREQEEHQRQLAAERERLARERADLEKKKQSVVETEESYQARIAAQQRQAAEIESALKEKEAQLEAEREQAREAQRQAVQLQSEAEEMITQMVTRLEETAVEPEPVAETDEASATEANEAPDEKAALKGVDYDSMRREWKQSLGDNRKPKPEDYLAVLREGRRKPRPAAPKAVAPPTPLVAETRETIAASVEADEEVLREKLEEEEREQVVDEQAHAPRREHRRVATKGGLMRRSLAALIDLVLLMMALGIFLIIGRLVTGSQGGQARDLLLALGLPFYILFILLAAAYVTYAHGTYGQTLGQRLLHLRVVTTHGEELTYLTAFFRFVAMCFAVGFLAMGVVWIGLDPNKQGWHDKLARTVVVKT